MYRMTSFLLEFLEEKKNRIFFGVFNVGGKMYTESSKKCMDWEFSNMDTGIQI